jgi:hypothetical protein
MLWLPSSRTSLSSIFLVVLQSAGTPPRGGRTDGPWLVVHSAL